MAVVPVNDVQAAIYGLIQGLTEFLPISSSAHLRIAPALFGWKDPGAAFTANIQLGTLLAVLVYFFGDITSILREWVRGIFDSTLRDAQGYRLGWAMFWGTLPIIVLGFAFKDQIETSLRSLQIVAIMLIVMAIVLFIAERVSQQDRELSETRVGHGIVVGLFQALALIPGASRSGSTIAGALFLGFERSTAARLSFLLSVPAILLSGLYSTYKHREEFSLMVQPLLIANGVSFVVGLICIHGLIQLLKRHSTLAFIVYRIVLGVAILVLIQSARLDPFAGM